MSKYIQSLHDKRERLAADQDSVVEEILVDSINPQRTAYLLRRMEYLIAEQTETAKHLDVWLERSKKTWWERVTGT